MALQHLHRASRYVRSASAACLSVAVLAGCTSAVNQEDETDSPTEPQAGGVLTVASSADAQPASILAQRAGNFPWRMLVFESLTRYDEGGEPQPLLATDWTLSEDRLSMVVNLRDDVTFHSGRPMTAEDVAFSLEQVQEPANASQVRAVAEQVTEISVTGEHQVTLEFAQPLAAVFDLFELMPIVDADTFDEIGDGEIVIGTGPFTWEDWQPGASISLERHDGYREDALPYVDSVEIPIITDSTALQTAVESGRAEIGFGLTPRDATSLADRGQYELLHAGGTVYLLGMDVEAEPFDDQRVRQAVGHAIDRERILNQVFADEGDVTNLWWSPSEPGHSDELATARDYDPDLAQQMIEEAGAVGAEVPIVVPAIPAVQNISEIVQFNLSEVGLTPVPVTLDVTEFDARQVEGELGPAFQLLHGLVGFSAATLLDAMPSLRDGNPSNFDTPEYRDLRAAVQESADPEREEAVATLSEYLIDQAFSQVLVQAPDLVVVSSDVHDVGVTALGHLIATRTYLD